MAERASESGDDHRAHGGIDLPAPIGALLFDLDGVVTSTATLHAAAWKTVFDKFLASRSKGDFTPFDIDHDYREYVDGKLREDGVRGFLQSRGLTLPEGDDRDEPGAPTVEGLAKEKNALLVEKIERDGVEVFPGAVAFIDGARAAGLRTALVSASANAMTVLRVTKLSDRFDVVVDGRYAATYSLPGKPAPDTYLAAARELQFAPAHAAVFEDALAGVEAGRAGHFGFVVGVEHDNDAAELRAHGADRVVRDLAELLSGGARGDADAR